ncbi:hypothetical protein Tco_0911386 [Tanacetum coccineum]|uniref:Uncharacterized protein n=1 Tax=Tanacetum coccineum TaxID=301880 RepID=A0ABQ5CYU3_9ASTR
MLVQPQGEAPSISLSRITSSPSLPSHHTASSTPTTPPSTYHLHEAEAPATMPHESPLYSFHSHGSDEGRMQQHDLTVLVTKLLDRIEAFETDLKKNKKTYSTALTKLVSKVKKLENQLKSGKARRRAGIEHTKIQDKTSADTEVLVQEDTPTELVEDVGSGRKGDKEVSTTNVPVSTAGAEVSTASTDVSTAATTLISLDEELAQKFHEEEQERFNVKKELVSLQQQQIQSDYDTTLELERQWDEKKEVSAKPTQTQDIDWNDPIWDQVNTFVPMGSEIEKESSTPVEEEKAEEQVVQKSTERAEGRLKRKVSKAREDKNKRQKMHEDPEKLTLMEHVEVISDSEEVINVTPFPVKSLIVSWKSYCKNDVGYYEIYRADESYKTYRVFWEMIEDFDREDLLVLYRLFNEKYASTRPGFDNLLLWGDIKVMFDPEEDDEVWKNHNSQEFIEWKLYDSCGVHSLMLEEVTIYMLVEKKYPLPQETLSRMLRKKLHVNYNISEMAYELLRFIKSQLQQ